jgi:CHAT domain-containing protein/Flp pilus assembly protein TadD
MAHLFQQLSTLRRRCLPVNHRSLAPFACLLFLPELMVGSHGHKRTEQFNGAAVQIAQHPGGASNAVKEEQDIRLLEPGKSIERELAGGQTHTYQITLAEGQFLNVIVEQRGIDVVIKLLGPDGKQIAEFDSEIRKRGQETVSQVAEVAGSYRLNVLAKKKEAPAGSYEIQLMELHTATEKERVLQNARNLFVESHKLYFAGKYDEARPLAERALAIREKALGPDHRDVAASLNTLGTLHLSKGDYAKAESLYQRALVIWEKTLGSEHLRVADALNNLAIVYRNKGDYSRAESLYQRALAIVEKMLGPEDLALAAYLNNLAYLNYYNKGDYAKADLLYQRALTIKEKALGPEHPDVALSLQNLALLYSDKGDYIKAESMYQHVLAIMEKAHGPEHPDMALPFNNLARLYRDKGDYEKAEPLFQRALIIWEKVRGSGHALTAFAIDDLARLYRDKGDYEKAESMYRRALDIREKALGPEHPDVGASLNGIADLYLAKGDYLKAEPLCNRALMIKERTLGPDHFSIAYSLNSLAMLYAMKGDATQAVTFQSRASAVSERNLVINFATGSERQKLAYIATLSGQANQTVSLHVHSASNDPVACSLATTTVLQRKGRILDVMSDNLGTLRRRFNAQDQSLLNYLISTRAELATLMLRGPSASNPAQYQAEIKGLREQIEKQEAEISARSAEFRTQSRPVTLEAVQAAIPQDAMLVEFFSYLSYNAKNGKWGTSRYLAYAFGCRDDPGWVDLGERQAIDEAIAVLRHALGSPNRADVKQFARALDEKVMRPVRKLLGETRNVFLSPDGALNLIPFAALVDEHGRYLVENYSFTYLTSGRDLLRLQAKTPSRQGPMVVANPQFDLSENTIASNQPANQNTEARRSIDFTKQIFDPLPSTAVEARTIGGILPGAKVMTGAQATEAAIKRISGPSILHVATHGFFLADQKSEVANASLGIEERQLLFSEDPLLRTGLILAGANQRQSGAGEDGILTASEAAGLDLWGTKLVVLSACDTGLGEVKNGEGVYGLRRSLVLAGSESQVISLWKVDDKATRELMVGYYTGLKQGEGRSEALRNVQLKMLRSRDRRHPFYWAGFIQSGEWANLEGKR